MNTIPQVSASVNSVKETQDKVIPKEMQLFQEAVNKTACDFYQSLSQKSIPDHKNFMFFTPNLVGLLSLFYLQADLNKECSSDLIKQFKCALATSLNVDELTDEAHHQQFDKWMKNLHQRGAVKLHDAATFHFQQIQIMSLSKDYYNANKDFFTSPESRLNYYSPEIFQEYNREKINQRVSDLTEGRIPELIESNCLQATRVSLSAALFKGKWVYPFKSQYNSEEIFNNSDGSKVLVTMINKRMDQLRMAFDEEFKILELPFHGDISALFIKPTGRKRTLQEYMTEGNLLKLIGDDKRFSPQRGLSAGIPKMVFDDKLEILSLLKDQKVSDLFYQIFGASVDSQVSFSLDEEGVAVAQATLHASWLLSCDPVFKLDSPFGMVIYDKTSNTILGMAQVLKLAGKDPKAKE